MAINALIGGTSSNSYITVDQADALYLDTFQNEKWVALSTEQKEIALISATTNLEVLTYKGKKCDPSSDDPLKPQALQWPRQCHVCRGVTAKCDMIPSSIQWATAYLALELFENPDWPDDPSGGGGGGDKGSIKRQKLGELEQEFYDIKDGVNVKVDATAPLVLQRWPMLIDILSCWLESNFGGSRVIKRVRA